ncbi:hypothetical protein [Sphingomonas sp. STIS6.2]|uniref:hypothetical protein n=1 Tax=Sphingomonas sp. STIS6.2 TaxID=1379700 RepID=UPI0004DB5480|nr:hypothetical protein [Sphingomonas sp. STIS6.2]
MTDNIVKLDYNGLTKLVRDTNVTVAHTDADARVFTVFTESEPLFCYDANSIDEVRSLVIDTFRSYAKHFHDVDGFEVDFRIVGAETEEKLPIERVLSAQNLEPVFAEAA